MAKQIGTTFNNIASMAAKRASTILGSQVMSDVSGDREEKQMPAYGGIRG